MLTQTQEKLSTGKKVNSALDNPTNFFTAQALSERATSLTSLQDGINTGVQTVKAANKGLDTISTLLKQAKSIAEQAKNAGNGAASKGIDGTTAIVTNVGSTAVGTLAKTREATLSTNGLANADTLTFSTTKAGVQKTFVFTAGTDGTTVGELVDKVNASGVASAKINDNGTLSFDAAVGAADPFTIVNSAGAVGDLGFASATFTTAARTVTASANNQDYVSQFADVVAAINDAVKDSSFNGINLLQGGTNNTLSVTFDGASKSKIDVLSKDFTTSGAVIPVTTLNTTNAQSSIDTVDAALSKVRQTQANTATSSQSCRPVSTSPRSCRTCWKSAPTI